MKLLNHSLVNIVSGGSVYEASDGTVIWNRMPGICKTPSDVQKEKDLIKYYRDQNKTIIEVW